ncbi:MAG: polyprenyl synthetase family protein [Terriglobales bacterium]
MNPTLSESAAAAAADVVASDVMALVQDDLVLVEHELRDGAACAVEAVTAIGQHLQASGGKRIRAGLVLLAARLSACPEGPRVRLAAIVEMIHAATLIHDDVIDDSPLRRGQPSANAQWGNQRSVLAGDWLYMQSFRLALQERNFAVLDALIALTQQMVEGELVQLEMQGRVVSAAEHLDLMERKTARLFAVASQLGAMAAGAGAATVEQLGRFGRHLGLAFQMVDDILDFSAAAEVLGKPVGSDLRDGKMTLPAIYAHQAADAPGRAAIEMVLHGRPAEGTWARVSELVTRHGIARARRESREQAALATQALAGFPDSAWKSALLRLPAMVIARGH